MKKILLIILLLLSSKNVFSQRILWEEVFDDADIYSRGWKLVNNDSSAFEPLFFSPFNFVNLGQQNPQQGNYFFKFSFDDANYRNIADDWLITPKFYNILKGDSISFWCGAVDLNFKDSLKVWISESENDLTSFRLIDYFKVDGPVGAWHQKKYDLSEFNGKNIYFAVNYYIADGGPLGSSSDNVWVDHFILSGKGYGGIQPTSFELQQNFPNPFNPSTEISFSIPASSSVSIKIFDSIGREVLKLVDGNFGEGKYSVTFRGDNFSSGVYFYTMTAKGSEGNFNETKKMDLVK